MSSLRAIAINYLLEETNAKGISWKAAQEAKTKMNALTDAKVFDMLLEKSRSQGIDSCIDTYQSLNNWSIWNEGLK